MIAESQLLDHALEALDPAERPLLRERWESWEKLAISVEDEVRAAFQGARLRSRTEASHAFSQLEAYFSCTGRSGDTERLMRLFKLRHGGDGRSALDPALCGYGAWKERHDTLALTRRRNAMEEYEEGEYHRARAAYQALQGQVELPEPINDILDRRWGETPEKVCCNAREYGGVKGLVDSVESEIRVFARAGDEVRTRGLILYQWELIDEVRSEGPLYFRKKDIPTIIDFIGMWELRLAMVRSSDVEEKRSLAARILSTNLKMVLVERMDNTTRMNFDAYYPKGAVLCVVEAWLEEGWALDVLAGLWHSATDLGFPHLETAAVGAGLWYGGNPLQV